MAEYDVFITYRRKDTASVQPLVDALRSRGLTVWFDQSRIEDFAPITNEIRHGLANSKALLAWYSIDYSKSRPCQMELTAAFIAAQLEGDPRQRVWVINPESTADHIQPVELRDEQYAKAPKSNDEYTSLADHVAKKLSAIKTQLGAIIPLISPQQYGRKLVGSRDFVGRLPDLWKLQSALHGAKSAIITGESPSGLAQVSGMGGVGKSLLAEEYALRFSAAYPGGIFWLRVLGNDATRAALTADQQEAVRSDEFGNLAIQLGIDVSGLDSRQIEAAIAATFSTNHQNSFLWIVDDLASGLGSDAVRAWLAPHPSGKTLFTTRSREYQAIGNSIRLDVLAPNEAYELLCLYRKPSGPEEEEAARGIAADLGYHPLALAVCSRALEAKAGLQSFGEFRTALGNQGADELELAKEFVGVLPSGHEPSVAATLLRSVRSLGVEGVDFLRIASLLAAAPIPPSLVASVFSIVDGLDETDAGHRAALGFSQAEKASLSERSDENARTVHALVSRAIRFSERNTDRRDALSSGIVAALNKILPGVADVRTHQRLSLEVLHARELCSGNIDNVELLAVTSWVAEHDSERGAYASSRELQEKVLEISRRILGEEHPVTLTSMNNLAGTLRAQGDLNGAGKLGEKVLAIRRRILGEEHPDTVASMNNLAAILYAQGDLNGARGLQERALEIGKRIMGEEHPWTLRAVENVAANLWAQGDLNGARKLQEKVLAIRRRIQGEEHLDTVRSMSSLAEVLRTQGDLNGARGLQETVLEFRRRILGEEHPETLSSIDSLANTLRDQGDLNGARGLQEKSVEISRRILGEEHPNTLISMNNLALTLSAQDDMNGTRALHEKVLEIRTRIQGEEHPDRLTSMNNLASTLRALGDLKGARDLQQKVLEVRRRIFGQEHPATLTSMDNLAETLKDQGDLNGARKLQEKSVEISRRILGEEHPDTLISMNNLAYTFYAQKDLKRARALHQKVLEISKRTLGEEHPHTLSSMNGLANTLWAQRDLKGARALHEKALEIAKRTFGEEHRNTLTSMSNLAATLRAQGDLDGARGLQEKVLEVRRRILGRGPSR